MTDEIRIEYWYLEDVQRWDKNPKRHDIGALVESIRRYGMVDPPKIDSTLGALVYGNGRAEALAWMHAQGDSPPRGIKVEDGRWKMPVKVGIDSVSIEEAEALAIDHNNLTMSGGDFTGFDFARMWDAGYTDVLQGLGDALPLTVDGDALDALLAGMAGDVEPGDGGDEFDTTPEDGPTRTALGDLWIIGGVHRLIVGDCTDPAVVERLMGGERAEMVFTDPPYGVDYEGGRNPESNTLREKLAGDTSGATYYECMSITSTHCLDSAPWYIWFAGSIGKPVYDAVDMCGYTVRAMIVWNKLNPHYGNFMAQYMQRHEPCLYCVKSTPPWHGPTNEVTVWDVKQPTINEFHPTQKPIELPERAIRNSSKRGALVCDWFLGSGTTLIAAHRTGRRCYGVEISPKYADVILRRAEAEGLTVERAADG
jgi:DNA modification methylase